ncbi:hypothetical protein [Streptomyces purpurascens]|uniref:Uncharacterized protein n=1 Tax=Streptomyces purpurascens TaxID=1924 RepID=A0ABZ1MWH4_STREF|nr:hypothetical protein [Streptomyces purpurascens]MCE7051579.1 hypothetical protein [Streptomyces purpurascens]GHA02575.1 hypothetical protein GCM10010303_09570 [Streptomyces purpurascens]
MVFPNPDAVLRLATAAFAELHDGWTLSPGRCLSEESMAAVYTNTDTTTLPTTTND